MLAMVASNNYMLYSTVQYSSIVE